MPVCNHYQVTTITISIVKLSYLINYRFLHFVLSRSCKEGSTEAKKVQRNILHSLVLNSTVVLCILTPDIISEYYAM